MHYVFLFILVSNIFPPPFISVPVPLPVPVRVRVYARMRSVLVRLVVVGVRACMRGYGLGGWPMPARMPGRASVGTGAGVGGRVGSAGVWG